MANLNADMGSVVHSWLSWTIQACVSRWEVWNHVPTLIHMMELKHSISNSNSGIVPGKVKETNPNSNLCYVNKISRQESLVSLLFQTTDISKFLGLITPLLRKIVFSCPSILGLNLGTSSRMCKNNYPDRGLQISFSGPIKSLRKLVFLSGILRNSGVLSYCRAAVEFWFPMTLSKVVTMLS